MKFILSIFLLSNLLLSDSTIERKGLFFDIGIGAGYNFYQDYNNNGNLNLAGKVGYGFNNQLIAFIDYPTLYSEITINSNKKNFDNDILMLGIRYLLYNKNTPYFTFSIGKDFAKLDGDNSRNNFGESWSIEGGYEFNSGKPWYLGIKYIETNHNQIDFKSINFIIGINIYKAFGI